MQDYVPKFLNLVSEALSIAIKTAFDQLPVVDLPTRVRFGIARIASARIGVSQERLDKHGYLRVVATRIKGFPREIVIVDKAEWSGSSNRRATTLRNDLIHPMRTQDERLSERLKDFEPVRIRALAIGAQTAGALALGAVAIGTIALGVVAIGRLVIGRAKIRRLEIDELVVRRIRVTDSLETPDSTSAGPARS